MTKPLSSRFATAWLLLLLPFAAAAQVHDQAADAGVSAYEPRNPVRITHPDWSRNAAIYQINLRQFTPQGTLAAAAKELPRIKALGADIVWLMPIHPIGLKNRKGSLGSPYSVRDYYAVNPEFGTLDDLKAFVGRAHELDMFVILDWVANHTAWDNSLVETHPDWYERDWKGEYRPTPWWDWSDIIDLDYSKPGLREYMTEAMKYWVREAGIDGYRCDVAFYVPLDFWENLRRELERIKPVFMLAEAEFRDLHAASFDATYAWSWHNAMHEIAQGKSDVYALFIYYSGNEGAWPRDAMRMTFVSNHDKNSWEGTQFELFGDALEGAIVLSVVGEGIPLVYNGQEAGNEKRLAFFEKDPIEWRDHRIGDLYRQLLNLRKEHRVLWNGADGARMLHVPNSAPAQVFSFVRRNREEQIFAVFNFSPEAQKIRFAESLYTGSYVDVFSGAPFVAEEDLEMELAPWAFRVFLGARRTGH